LADHTLFQFLNGKVELFESDVIFFDEFCKKAVHWINMALNMIYCSE